MGRRALEFARPHRVSRCGTRRNDSRHRSDAGNGQLKIAVLFGGTSDERDVSIASAAQIIPVLRDLGHEVFAVDTASGRLGFAQEQKLLTAAVAAAPPSDTEITRVRGEALALAPGAVDF